MKNDNLSKRIYAAKFEINGEALSAEEKAAIVSMVGKGCRADTKARIARRLELPLSLWTDYGIYSRVMLEANRVDYCAGQDYNAEMRVLRECILD